MDKSELIQTVMGSIIVVLTMMIAWGKIVLKRQETEAQQKALNVQRDALLTTEHQETREERDAYRKELNEVRELQQHTLARLSALELKDKDKDVAIEEQRQTISAMERIVQTKETTLKRVTAEKETLHKELTELRARVGQLETDFKALLLEKEELAKRLVDTEEALRVVKHDRDIIAASRDALLQGMDTVKAVLSVHPAASESMEAVPEAAHEATDDPHVKENEQK